jgi:retinol dehydrogenase 12
LYLQRELQASAVCFISCFAFAISGETGNKEVYYEQVDLADWKSVQQLSQRINSRETKLDVLINNAGF